MSALRDVIPSSRCIDDAVAAPIGGTDTWTVEVDKLWFLGMETTRSRDLG